METQVERRLRYVPALGEAMHDAADVAGALLAHDRKRVGGGGPGVNHQRLAAVAGGANMGAEPRPLPFQVPGQAIVVESGLADGDDLRPAGELAQAADRRLRRVFVVWVYADARIDVRVFRGDAQHAGEVGQIHADAQRVCHPFRRHRVEDGGELRRQFRKIDVAMGVDEHVRREGIRADQPWGRSGASV